MEEFLRLNRRRVRALPPLAPREHERWLDLRWRLEEALVGGPGPSARRGPPRKALRVPASLEVEYAEPDREVLCSAEEIGEGGLFLATGHPVGVGTPLHLKLCIDTGESVEVEGAVVWVRRPGDAGGPPGMGIQFEGLDDAQREAVACLVETALAALRPC